MEYINLLAINHSLKLKDNAQIRFRWVVCQIDSLKKCIRPKDVQNALKSLPTTLNEFYARALLGIDESYRQMAIRALQWLAFSKKPIAIEELAEAVIIDPEATPSFDRTDRLLDSHDVLKVLSSLVTVYKSRRWAFDYQEIEEIEEIRLAHFSVKHRVFDLQPAEA